MTKKCIRLCKNRKSVCRRRCEDFSCNFRCRVKFVECQSFKLFIYRYLKLTMTLSDSEHSLKRWSVRNTVHAIMVVHKDASWVLTLFRKVQKGKNLDNWRKKSVRVFTHNPVVWKRPVWTRYRIAEGVSVILSTKSLLGFYVLIFMRKIIKHALKAVITGNVIKSVKMIWTKY